MVSSDQRSIKAPLKKKKKKKIPNWRYMYNFYLESILMSDLELSINGMIYAKYLTEIIEWIERKEMTVRLLVLYVQIKLGQMLSRSRA